MQQNQKSPLFIALLVSGVLSGISPLANALSLGAARVLSPIGQPLLAEIDVIDITADEAANLQVKVPGAEAFKAAGVDYTRIAGDVQVTLQKRANGRSYLRLASNQTVTDPFLDLIVEASWGSGRVVRDYTLLLDPPSNANTAAAKPAVAESLPVAPVARYVPPPAARAPRAPRADNVTGEPRATPAKAARAPQAPALSPSVPSSGQTYTVQGGDSLSKIANQVKPTTVSLDQMLAALFQANQSSFTNGNINRLQKGTVLQLPADGAAATIAAADARRIVVAQSRDFANYRANLAKAVGDKPAAVADGSQSAGSGKLDTKVQDSKSTAAQPDKLTLSKGQIAGKGETQVAQVDQVAKTREAKASQERMAELNRNVSDLAKIAGGGAAAATAAAAAASKPTTPAVTVPVKPPVTPPTVAVASAPAKLAEVVKSAVVASAPATAVTASAPAVAKAASTTVTTASAPAATVATTPAPVASAAASPAASAPVVAASAVDAAPVKKVVAPPAPAPEVGFFDSLLDNDLLKYLLGALAVGLAGFGVWKLRKGKSGGDSSSFDSQSQAADSFFGGTGGARVDTRDSVLASSMYSSSQLNANEVDPVAEADVYLAYGRDLQAEEILKEALRGQPERHSIRVKLLEIYTKRRDARSFEVVATELFSMTQGQGEDWARAVELGRELEPANALYNTQAGSSQLLTSGASDFPPSGTSPFDSPTTLPASRSMASGFAPTDVSAARTTQAMRPDTDLDLDLDLSIGGLATPPAAPAPHTRAPVIAASKSDDFSSMSFDMPSSIMSPKTAPTPAPMEFDMSSINLDMGASSHAEVPSDPYETKFALAEECQRLGDKDSARSILREIIDMATGAIRSKAEKMLGDIR